MYVEDGVTIYDNYDYSFPYDEDSIIYAHSHYDAKSSAYNSYPTSHKLYLAPIDTEIPDSGLEFTGFRLPKGFRACGESKQYGPGFDEELRDRLAREGKGIWEIKRIMDTKIAEQYIFGY